MGLLDGMLGSLLGGANPTGGGANPMAAVITGLLQQHGGIGGLVGQLAQGGLASQVQSWVGTGPNPPVTGDQITAALGSGPVAQVARQLGIDPAQAGNILAQVLPHVIDHLTPTGQVPTGAAASPGADLISSALSVLAGRLRS